MPSTRKKKEKKKDFQKPKLKVGKTALNPANHTSTSFKSKKINISSTTKHLLSSSNTSSSVPDFSKKLSLLRKSTGNLNSRKEILTELLDLLNKDPENIYNNLPLDEIIKILKLLFLDQSKKIRSDSRNVLIKLISHHNNLIILNHDSLMLFIFSAMTHLKPTIRHDSIFTLRSILNGGERLKSLTIANHWIRVWKNIMVLMNWKRENKSYVDSNDFKDFQGMRLEQLTFLNEFLIDGCLNANDNDDNSDSSSYTLLSTYMIKPNMGMLYRNLKLFGNININKSDEHSTELDDSILCEDVNDRIKTFIEGFYTPVTTGLQDFQKVDDLKIVDIATKLSNTVQQVKHLYDEIAD